MSHKCGRCLYRVGRLANSFYNRRTRRLTNLFRFRLWYTYSKCCKKSTDFREWGNDSMQLPDIVRQIGKAEEKEQVYIEEIGRAHV